MGVLDPVKRNADEMEELKDSYSEMVEWTVENLDKYAGAILNDRHDLMEDEDPFFFLIWRDEDIMEISSMEEIEEEKRTLKMLKEDISLGALEGRYARAFAEKKDVEPDYSNPVESYGELDELEESLEGIDSRIKDKIIEKFDLDPDIVGQEYDRFDYMALEMFFTLSDRINALPFIESITESQQNIEREKENLLAKAVDEHREDRNSVDPEYDRADIPLEPVDWEEVIEEENIRDFMDISDLPSVTYGDSLHMMMEELAEDVEGVEPEYPLHFRNTGGKNDVPLGNRIDNTLRPDAVDDLFVYEFKHMPVEQKEHLQQNGGIEMNGKHRENIEQVNLYLNELDLPAGMLVYVSSDMEVKEYVVERHDHNPSNDKEEYMAQFIHEKEDYDFNNIFSDEVL